MRTPCFEPSCSSTTWRWWARAPGSDACLSPLCSRRPLLPLPQPLAQRGTHGPSPSCVFYSRFLTKTGRQCISVDTLPTTLLNLEMKARLSVSLPAWPSPGPGTSNGLTRRRERRTEALPLLLPPWSPEVLDRVLMGRRELWGAIPGAWTYAGRPCLTPPLVSGSLLPFGCVCERARVCVLIFFMEKWTKKIERERYLTAINWPHVAPALSVCVSVHLQYGEGLGSVEL
jgi:hypothetical protein